VYIAFSTSEACILQTQYVTLYNLISLVKTTLINLAVAVVFNLMYQSKMMQGTTLMQTNGNTQTMVVADSVNSLVYH
jgi:hypothetical protein